MGTEDNPDVTVQYYDEGTEDWIDLTQNGLHSYGITKS